MIDIDSGDDNDGAEPAQSAPRRKRPRCQATVKTESGPFLYLVIATHDGFHPKLCKENLTEEELDAEFGGGGFLWGCILGQWVLSTANSSADSWTNDLRLTITRKPDDTCGYLEFKSLRY